MSTDTIDEKRRRLLIGGSGGLAAAFIGAGEMLSTGNTYAGSADGAIKYPGYVPADAFFGPAYIDVDEWHDKPLRFRYLHGGFKGTDTRFSFYMPEKRIYGGRFFQTLPGGNGGSEYSVLDAIHNYDQFGVVPPLSLLGAFKRRGYLIESNQGHFGDDLSGIKDDPTILAYRASEQTARFAKVIAAQMYGSAPKYGYLYGGSGGAVRSLNCLEYVQGLWDGAVPIVAPMQSTGIFFSQQLNAVRLLGPDGMARLADAVEVGGSGQPFDGLTAQAQEALSILYKTGFPRDIGVDNPREAVLVWTYQNESFRRFDPSYFDDFWNKTGYLGHDEPELLKADRISFKSKVRRILTGAELATYQPTLKVIDERGMGEAGRYRQGRDMSRPFAVMLEGGDELLSRMGGSSISFTSGAAKGRERFVFGVIGDAIMVGGIGAELLEGVKAGDEVTIDNGKYLAFCYFYRHQAEPEFREWSHSVVDGKPIYVQRPRLKSMVSIAPHKFTIGNRKLIFVSSMQDRGVLATGFAADIEQLRRVRGEAFVKNNVRVWLNDHAWHGGVPDSVSPGGPVPALNTRLINYEGSVHRALRALMEWVEQGKEPEASTNYTYTSDANILLPPTAKERRGVQPTVELTANGQVGRVEVKTGQSVKFSATAETPPHTGQIVRVEWDFDGQGLFPRTEAGIDGKSSKLTTNSEYSFSKPGTYFPCVRVSSHPTGDVDDPVYRLLNLGRIRVVVS